MGLLMGGRGGLLPMLGASGVPATEVPRSIPDLWAWWDIATLSTLYQNSANTTPVATNGDPIGYIADRSGNGRYVRQTGATGTRPTYTTGTQNGLPGALFDGGDYLDSVATIDSLPLTILGVWKRGGTVGATQGQISAYDSGGGGARLRYNTGNAIIVESSASANGGIVGANTPFVFGGRFTAAAVDAVNNGAITTTPTSASAITNIMSIGRYNINNTSALGNGSLCEVCIYNRALSDAEITSLSTYLNSKWSVY